MSTDARQLKLNVEIQKSSPENTIEKSQKCKRCSLQMCTSRLHSNGWTNAKFAIKIAQFTYNL